MIVEDLETMYEDPDSELSKAFDAIDLAENELGLLSQELDELAVTLHKHVRLLEDAVESGDAELFRQRVITAQNYPRRVEALRKALRGMMAYRERPRKTR